MLSVTENMHKEILLTCDFLVTAQPHVMDALIIRKEINNIRFISHLISSYRSGSVIRAVSSSSLVQKLEAECVNVSVGL